jgi:GNAT superfamily N-acetyltransferase
VQQLIPIRGARPDDALGIATAQVVSWQATYAYGLNADYLASLSGEGWAPRHRARLENPDHPAAYFVAVNGEDIVGFCMYGPARPDGNNIPETLGAIAEVYALYVLPTAIGRGLGARLLAAARDDLLRRGATDLLLWVMEGNHHAIAFYARQGLPLDGERKEDGWDAAGFWIDLRCSAPLIEVCPRV